MVTSVIRSILSSRQTPCGAGRTDNPRGRETIHSIDLRTPADEMSPLGLDAAVRLIEELLAIAQGSSCRPLVRHKDLAGG
jgi:hypothetical protein